MSEKMPDVIREVTVEDVNTLPGTEELPDQLREAAVLYDELGKDWVDELSRQGVVLRKNGYQMPTLLLFFLALFTGNFTRSIKTVCRELNRPKNRLLAAFAGLKSFPEQSSVSRFLVRVRQQALEEVMGWMLVFSLRDSRELLTHPACVCRDTFGQPWHLFDLDPTATVLRQRAVLEDEEHPPAERTSDSIARAGYPGRKRGEVLFRRTVLQHAGSTLWLGSWLRPGNGGSRETFAAAIKTVVQCCEFAGFGKDRALLRIDGEGGGVPTIAACIEAGIGYVTRCIHYSLLDRPDVRQQMMTGSWFEVRDSGSGPRRFALDLGELELFPSSNTVRDDGTHYEPVLARIVLSRYEASEKSSSGVFLDGAVYELFATGLCGAAWPAEEVVTLYCQHATQENQFAREDKELGLDTLFSYEPAGQALVTLIGLLVWNLRVLLGFRVADQELEREPLQSVSARQSRPAPPPIETPTIETRELSEEDTAELSEEDALTAGSSLNATDPLVAIKRLLREEINRQAQGLACEGFSWDMEQGLTCQEGHVFEVAWTRKLDGKDYANLRAPSTLCSPCPSRQDCTRSTNPGYRKERAVLIKDPHPINELLRQLKQAQTESNRHRAHLSRTSKSRISPLSIDELTPEFAPHVPTSAGPLEIQFPMLNTAALKHRFTETIHDLAIQVRQQPEPAPTLRRRYTYTSREERGRRRRTWSQRLAYNQRKAKVDIHVLRAPAAVALFSHA